MQPNKVQKAIIAVLIIGQAALIPGFALAFLSTASGAVNAIPISDSGSVVGNTVFDGVFTPLKTTYTSCSLTIKTFEATDNTTQLGFSFSTLIGGGGALATQLGVEIAAYNTYLGCLTGLITSLNTLVAPNSYTSSLKQQLVSQVNGSISTYQAKLKTAQARYNVASQNIWKALLITILINTTKSVADQLVNKLVNNYKIANLKQYTDSVATLMYDNQFLRNNFPASQDQMMARQILTNPLARSQIQPGIYVAANNALGFTPSTLSPSDPNYYTKMAAVGSSPANPYFIQTSFVSGVDQSHASALNTAQAHISQGNGYKAPVNCAGSLAQQQQIDAQAKAAQALLANRTQLLTQLQQGGGSASDIAKAQADVNSANAAWQNLPYTVTGNNAVGNASASGGNNTEGTAAIIMCEAVSSPAVLVNQGIDAVFKSLNLGQYNNSNLPGSLAAISTMATQIGSSLVLGAINGTGPGTINENQIINQGVTAAAGIAAATYSTNAQANLANGIDFEASNNSSVTNGYSFTWTVVTTQVPTASYVTITGPGIAGATSKLPLSGSYAVVSATTGTYLLTVFNSAGKAVTSANLNTTPTTTNTGTNGGLTYNNSSAPIVAGAFTDKPQLDIRGPAVVVTPRGE